MRLERIVMKKNLTRSDLHVYFPPMPQCNIDRSATALNRLATIDGSLRVHGMPATTLTLKLVLLITSGGAG